MAETQTSTDERSSMARNPQYYSQPERDSAPQASENVSSLNIASLMRSTGLSGRGNSAVRAETMLGAQQTHGNRAVQRFMQGSGTAATSRQASQGGLAVQREEDDEWASGDEDARDLGDVDQLNEPDRDFGDADQWEQPRDLGDVDQLNQPDRDLGDIDQLNQPDRDLGDADQWAVNQGWGTVAMDGLGAMPGVGTMWSAGQTVADLSNIPDALSKGDNEAVSKNLDAAAWDGMGMIPGLGTAMSFGSLAHDAYQTGRRSNGVSTQDAPMWSDVWHQGSEASRQIQGSQPPQPGTGWMPM